MNPELFLKQSSEFKKTALIGTALFAVVGGMIFHAQWSYKKEQQELLDAQIAEDRRQRIQRLTDAQAEVAKRAQSQVQAAAARDAAVALKEQIEAARKSRDDD